MRAGEPVDRFLARNGLGSWAAVRELIHRGRVQVDGAPCRHYHRPLPAGARVAVDGAAVTVDGLHKAYGSVRAVDGVDFEIRKGETLSLVGWGVAYFAALWALPMLAPRLPVGEPGSAMNYAAAFACAFFVGCGAFVRPIAGKSRVRVLAEIGRAHV